MNQEWNAEKYASDFSFVYDYGNDVTKLLDGDNIRSVLDLGCGNGALSERLFNKGYSVIGMDSSEKMLAAARERFPKIKFVRADAADFSLEQPVDAVFSNAVLHWINKGKQPAVASCVYNALKSGGRFVFEMGGKGNNALIHAALERTFEEAGLKYEMPFYFPSVGEYASILEKAGFKVGYAVLFDRPTELKGENGMAEWIKMFVNVPFSGIDEKTRSELVGRAAEKLRGALFAGGKWYADYVRLRMKATKE
ncbi:MAG: methyltransferase domain-containing protein [Lachnospiraceae bacterium]|nr:methyltransferase domain-containing protein [Ruminococcus sp.]MCM1275295.1 methyltransferase domain-containing protein [Lachnospiraceae bacterium]